MANSSGVECKFLFELLNRIQAHRASNISESNRRRRQDGTRALQQQTHPVIEVPQKSVPFVKEALGPSVQGADLAKMEDERRCAAFCRKGDAVAELQVARHEVDVAHSA